MTTTDLIKQLRTVKTWEDKPKLRELVMELIQKHQKLRGFCIGHVDHAKWTLETLMMAVDKGE